MGNQNKGNPEKYKASDWSKLSRRARGPRGHRSSKIKRRMVQHVQSRNDLTPSAKLVGAILVNWYNERLGYSWPSTATLASEVGLTKRSVERATGELHELEIVHKVVGGGWDKGKIRHNSNRYYPAFSLVLESAENGGNPPEYSDNMSAPSNCRPLEANNRQNTADVPRHIVGPYGDRHMANASASPATANASTASHAPPGESEVDEISLEWEEEDGEIQRQEYSVIVLVSDTVFPGFRPWFSLDRITSGQGLSDDMLVGLDMYAQQVANRSDLTPSNAETLEGDEYDLLVVASKDGHRLTSDKRRTTMDWKAELHGPNTVSQTSRIKLVFWY